VQQHAVDIGRRTPAEARDNEIAIALAQAIASALADLPFIVGRLMQAVRRRCLAHTSFRYSGAALPGRAGYDLTLGCWCDRQVRWKAIFWLVLIQSNRMSQ